jgi:peptidoglycan hydrolase-like protein with peptidoglycan-binding domain
VIGQRDGLSPGDLAGVQALSGGAAPPPPPPWPGRLFKHPPVTRGADVLAWQNRMNARGYGLVADGAYGKNSKAVCVKFQLEQGLEADGIVGRLTWDRTFAPL